MESSESSLTIKERTHTLTQTHTHTHRLVFLWCHRTCHRARWGKGAFRVSGIQLCKLSTVKLLRMLLHFCIPSQMGILCDLSAFALTVQVKWSTCPQPSSWNRSTGSSEESLLIHRECGGQAFPSPGIKATFIEIYREPCRNPYNCSTRQLKSYGTSAKLTFFILPRGEALWSQERLDQSAVS